MLRRNHLNHLLCLVGAALLLPPLVYAAQSPVKIFIQESGIYSVTSAELDVAGFSVTGIDVQNLQMRHRGVEVPILIEEKVNGSFEVVFYAAGIDRDSPEFEYTDTDVYWLSEGSGIGKRITEREVSSTLPVVTAPISFPDTVRLEVNYLYKANLDLPNRDFWFWESLPDPKISPPEPFPVTRNHVFPINEFDSSTTVRVRAALQGAASSGHHTRVSLNSCLADDDQWSGTVPFLHDAVLSSSCLVSGTNILTLESLGDFNATVGGNLIDRVYSNWFEIEYSRPFIANNDMIEFELSADGVTHKVPITGFSAGTVEIFDITDPGNVNSVSSTTVGGTTTVEDSFAQSATRRYIALRPPQRKVPLQLILDTPSSLRAVTQGADYLIISHKDFISSAQPLASLRAAQGLRVMTIDITDIFDEFADGIFDPLAIPLFLAYAFDQWQRPAPTYVLLIGDATLDPKDNSGIGEKTYVPTRLIESVGVQIPSDMQLVTFKGDDPIPEMFIGRLPVKTEAEADILINKIVQYENSPPFQDSDSPISFVADVQPDPKGAGNFHDLAAELAAIVQGGDFSTSTVFAEEPQAPVSVQDLFNQGSPIVTFIGHGDFFRWSSFEVMSVSAPRNDVELLSNGVKAPLIIALSCLNNYFIRPLVDTLGETFVKAEDKGAIAFWGGTGFGFTSEHTVISREFFKTVAASSSVTLGPTTAAAIQPVIQGLISQDLTDQLVLLGDPATKIVLPQGTGSPGSTSGGGSTSDGGSSGGGGGGCSVAKTALLDPVFPLLMLVALIWVCYRRVPQAQASSYVR